ncbi:putative protein N(5)-glutamine methyltransferase [Halostreptopolyspora alba]|uniref:peptide chain release factor N(5)-glutamine methyltransferase n=1 Tax=Halostreptopolyspora alba TaxID=2487137 RepID=A0A3N0E677_9ACTN|nr:putative protein N(5)-glutamine methyltransferase [Nocardiopsaceae bacterium YIM 96095]
MTAHPPPPSCPPPGLVSRLRSAGCVFAEDEARLLLATTSAPDDLEAMVERRVAGEPIEHVLGWAEFRGLRIAVDPGVFVPRRRTEFLAGRAATLCRPGDVVVDLCCGSGAVGAALVAEVGGVELHAVDVDPATVRCARRNVHTVDGRVYQGDLYGPLPGELRGRVAVLVANTPYVPTGEFGLMPTEARDHEPRVALDGGTDGLDVQRRVAASAPRWLAPGGHLLVEASERQAPLVAELFAANGLGPWVASCEELDATVVVGSRPGAPGAGRSRRDR